MPQLPLPLLLGLPLAFFGVEMDGRAVLVQAAASEA